MIGDIIGENIGFFDPVQKRVVRRKYDDMVNENFNSSKNNVFELVSRWLTAVRCTRLPSINSISE